MNKVESEAGNIEQKERKKERKKERTIKIEIKFKRERKLMSVFN